MPFVPAIPDRDQLPIALPIQVEKSERSFFIDAHAILFDVDLGTAFFSPGSEHGFCIFVAEDYDIQGLGGPKIAYGH